MAADKANRGVSDQEAQRQEIGADWEDAFQAEDYLVSPDSTPEALFGQKTASAADQRTIREALSSPADQAVVVQPAGGRKKGGKIWSILLRPFEAMGRHPLLEAFGRLSVGRWFGALSSVGRGAMFTCFAGGLFALLCWSFFLWTGDESVKEHPVPVALQDVLGGKTAATRRNVDGWGNRSASESGEAIEPLFAAQQSRKLFENGADQRKWRFSSFMIDAGSDEEGKINYLVLDLSLVFRLDPGADLPFDKKYAIRNMIYQFFSNRPIYELRRFSLARGEMKQKIRAWFDKEWPDNSIESVLFHRYLII
jgi:hypothetical protein